MFRRLAACLALAGALTAPALAADLRIGLPDATTSLDPLFYVAGSNTQVALHLYDPLVRQDAHQLLMPALATAWRAVDDTTWEFTLRPGVRFHSGAAFGPEDVIASVRHVEGITNSPSSLRPYVAGVAAMEVVSPTVLRIRTNGPRPLLANDLSRISIIPRAQQDTPAAAFEGKQVDGTGPFALAEWARGASVKLVRNEAYWAGAPAWEHVELRSMGDGGARVAALLAGDIDVIAQVPSEAQAAVLGNARVHMVSAAGNRLIYLHIDSDRTETPFARDAAGKPLANNPLKDPRVRRALSLAIDRKALVERVMDGQGTPAGQFVPPGFAGYDAALAAPAMDVAAARALLTEAGYPNGFNLTIHGPNDRYPNDAKLLQAIAQFFTRAGVRTAVDVQPGASFFTRASRLEYSMIMGGAAIETGELTGILNPLLATYDADKGLGTGNRGRWSNPRFDALLAEAYRTFDEPARTALLQQASRIAAEDTGVIPVLFLQNTWGLRRGLDYAGRGDGYTLADQVRAAP